MDNQLITIATFPFHTDPRLSLLVARLDHEDIACSAADATTVAVDPLLSPALGGVKVQVRAADAPRAWEIYQDIEQSMLREPEFVPDAEEREWEAERARSQEGVRQQFFLGLAIVLALAVLLMLLL